ncbi:MAG: hypothetical protein A2785_03875 [Candidatus Chisholmbacteria bacterium RIFCSPHIGHO2_01_FULL_49_18]|uniref:Bacteriocin-protection protein, YdeI/OmpD-associated family n=2 Tax=Candidatus Chisholmiibacteriota TaxID=1817900 RepID=A0A1G1VNB0_9BACT|nr:MAG: hypothetical protein A2785_03875 [Candidatus Chisholmbacteria bacterium RIFCSPHIGHO2_01_FULL_49_18]OGY19431.1 MAG: hypothetical protein A3A65_05985 [Candidatus Chisholmbacteria bacterium RIFCSPLOWO2_01_FULL_49_14]
MKIGKTLYVTDRKSWRAWLAKNHDKEKEIWLIYYRKKTSKPRISYDDAVLEALAFGWIDSTAKKIDNERFAQRFSPRRKTSGFSQMNKERIRELIKQKRMTKAGLAAIAHVYDPKTDKKEKFTIPAGILKALMADKDTWKNFLKMPGPYKRIRVAYIESRKRHGVAMYQRALKHFVKMTAQNKRIGFVKERH